MIDGGQRVSVDAGAKNNREVLHVVGKCHFSLEKKNSFGTNVLMSITDVFAGWLIL